MDRRLFVMSCLQAPFALAVGHTVGKGSAYFAEKKLNNIPSSKNQEEESPNKPEKNQPEQRQPFNRSNANAIDSASDTKYWTGVTAGTLGTYGLITIGSESIPLVQGANIRERAVELSVPENERPPEMKSMNDYVSQSSRREAIFALGRGLATGALLGPLLSTGIDMGHSYLLDDTPKDLSTEKLAHKTERDSVQSRRNTVAISLLTGSIAASNAYQHAVLFGSGTELAKVYAKHELVEGLKDKKEFTFEVQDGVLNGEDLRDILPDNLKNKDLCLGITIVRKDERDIRTTIVYDKLPNESEPKFLIKDISGALKDEPVILRFRDKIALRGPN